MISPYQRGDYRELFGIPRQVIVLTIETRVNRPYEGYDVRRTTRGSSYANGLQSAYSSFGKCVVTLPCAGRVMQRHICLTLYADVIKTSLTQRS